ncbi:DUF362 domain-containing protein [Sporomusa aerivorans]|uniref:DUF362 domain-containing protein n=1 Tax=Sporomusa aerivorans TaxID=204936 RepID=UPI00352A8F77
MNWSNNPLSRRNFIRLASGVVVSFTAFGLTGCSAITNKKNTSATSPNNNINSAIDTGTEHAKVFFTNNISTKGLIDIYSHINEGITGKVAIKLHTGEPHGPNLLPIDLIKSLQGTIPNSAIVECNVLYNSPRQHTETHREVLKTNGFTFCPVDIMDDEKDIMLPVPNIKERIEKKLVANPSAHIIEVPVGSHILNYDSMLVYTHFKGHTMGGFGGSLKNIGIGAASRNGKAIVHGEGWPIGKAFLTRMVESGFAIADHFKNHITYINVLKNMSVDCDCDAHGAPPTCNDIGILASTDILAIDQASIDLVYKLPENQRHDLVERIESREGLYQLDYMEELGLGNRKYDLIQI